MKTFSLTRTTFKVSDIIGWLKTKSLDLSPSFQRRSVWKPGAKSFLIDTVVRGFPMPIIFLREKGVDLESMATRREVVDGQQRIRTLVSYIHPKLLRDLRREFTAHVDYTDSTRRRVEKLHAHGHMYRKDVEIVYAGLFLDAFTAFERFIEELFLGLLSGGVTHRLASVRPRVTFKTREALWDIVIGPRYADWLPYEKTLKRSEAYFQGGMPFSRISTADKNRLDALLAIRHVLAHKSYHSTRSFEAKVLAGLALTSRERTPAGFLRSVYIAAPRRTRYEQAIDDLQLIAARLC